VTEAAMNKALAIALLVGSCHGASPALVVHDNIIDMIINNA
jgi:hypothetical protein